MDLSQRVMQLLNALRIRLQGWRGRLFYRRGYDYRRVVRKFGQDLSWLQELPVLMQLILDRVVNTWQLQTAALVLREEEGDPYLVRAIRGLPDRCLEASFSAEDEVVRRLSGPSQVLEWHRERGWLARLPSSERENLECLKSMLIVPLRVKDRLIGWLSLGEKRSERPYTPDDTELLGTLAGQASAALENAILYERRRREVAALEVLNRIGLAATTLELSDLLEQIYLEVSRLVDAPHFYIALYDEPTREFFYAFHVDNGVLQPVDRSMTWPMGQGLTSGIVLTGKPIVATDYLEECQRRGVSPPGEDSERRGLAWLGVPLLAGSRVLGVMSISSPREGTVYRPEHVRLLSTLAAQTAVVIERARSREREQQRVVELEALQEVAQAIGSSILLDELLQSIWRALQRILDVPNFHVALYDEKQAEFAFALYVERGQITDPPYRGWKMGEELTSELVRLRQPILTDDYVKECARRGIQPAGQPVKAWLGVPMIVGEEVIGVLVVSSYSAETVYTDNDLRLLSTVAAQVACAVENAREYQRTDAALARRVDELTALDEIARELNTSLDFLHVIEVVLDRAMAATTAQLGGVGIRTEDGAGLRVLAYRGPALPEGARRMVWSIQQGIVGRVMRTGQAALVADVFQDPDYVPIVESTRSELAVPIIYAGQTIGAINLEGDHEAAFDEESLRFLQRLADHAAVAISNARLFQERERRITELAILNEIGGALSSALDLSELVETVYQQVSRLFDTTNFYVAAYHEETDEWETLLEFEEGKRIPREQYRVGTGLTGYIIRNRAALLFRTAAEQEAFEAQAGITPVGRPSRSWLGVPLIAVDKVVGVMAIQSYDQEGLYSEQDLVLFSTIASQAAVAIANAHLFRGVTEARDRLQAILDSTRDGILLLDEDGRILLANPSVEQWMGLFQEGITGATLPQLLQQAPPEYVEMRRLVLEEFERSSQILAQNAQAPLHGTIEVSRQGVQYFEWLSLPVLDRAGRRGGRILVLRDVTEARAAERMREDLGSMIVHDLRGPLTAILGAAETILRRDIGPLTEAQRSLLQMAQDGAWHMQELVNTLLDIRRLEAGRMPLHFAPVDLAKVAHEAVAHLEPLIQERRLTMAVEMPSDLPAVRADAESIARVVENLLHNAIKYSYPGGVIRVSARQEGDMVLGAVTDYGIGIPKAEQEHIFEKFSQLSHAAMPRGTGLGLAFCRLTISAHNGKVWVESEEGKGSTFYFALPIWV